MQPLRKVVSSPLYLVILFEGLLATACYLAAVYAVHPIEAPIYLLYEGGAQHIALMSISFLLAGYLFDFYKHVRVRSRLVLILQLLHLIGIIFLVHAAITFLNPEMVAVPSVVMIGNALAFVMLVLWRLFVRPVLWGAIAKQKVLFVGSGAAVDRLASAFREDPSLGVQISGGVVASGVASPGVQCLGSFENLAHVIEEARPARVIVSVDGLRDKRVLKTLFDLRSSGLTVESAADAYETLFGRIYLPAIDPYTVIFRNDLAARPGSVALQSIYTNLLALIATVVALPLMVLIALLMKLTGSRTVLEKHACVGLYGVPFVQYRFACERGGALARFLTRYRLQGIPQVLNIVRGDMALIGPRAERVEFDRVLDGLIPFWRQKQSVKPGILGWSQLHCDVRPMEDTLERLEYDLYYIKYISLVLDAYVLLRGLKWILSGQGGAPEALPSLDPHKAATT